MPPTATAIVGTGIVARAVGRALIGCGEPVVAVASRTPGRAEEAAHEIGPGVRAALCEEIPSLASTVVIATSDDGLTLAAERLAAGGFSGGIAVHTAGSRGPEALAPLARQGTACGVMHPLLTIVGTLPSQFHGVAFGVCGAPDATAWAASLVAALGGRVLPVDGDQMARYHAAAVLASNALPGLLHAAARLMEQAGIHYEAALAALAPLTRAASETVFGLGPAAALTGPVVRGDVGTIARHVAALQSGPLDIARLYSAVSVSLLVLAERRGVSADSLASVRHAVEGAGAGEMDVD